MNKEDITYLESLLASLHTALYDMKAGSTMECGYMLEKLHAMERVLNDRVPIKMDKHQLRTLIFAHETAVRNLAFARGLKSGLDQKGHFLHDPEHCLMDYAQVADDAEAELNEFINSL